jgi:ATP-dependent Clp protease ATP-binding subunit ClpC
MIEELARDGDFLYAGRLGELCRPLGGGGSVAEALEGAVADRNIGFVAECSEAELVHCRRAQPSLVNACRVIEVHEAKSDRMLELMQIYQLRTRTPRIIGPRGLDRTVRLLDRYVLATRFPGKAFSFLDWLAREGSGSRPRTLDPDDVTRAFADYTGLPVELISDAHSATAEAVADRLTRGVVGQGDACAVSGRVLSRFKAGMSDPGRPLGALFFVGPTGVGKTELAKQIARYMFGDASRMARFDMAEYGHRGAARRLLDVGDGVVSLATRLAAQPLSLVLFDEIEKAHPEVHDMLLAVLDEGRVTDVDGRLVDARMALFVMTSNLGAASAPRVGFGDAASETYLGAVRAHFRPELFGRIDYVVPFRHLGPEDVAKIVDLELDKVRDRPGFARRGITLSVEPEVRAWLAERGYHREWGARPLRRLIEETIVSPTAIALAQHPAIRNARLTVVLDGAVPRIRI